MSRILFVTNGHGETAIAERIATDLRTMLPGALLDHLALVGDQPTQIMHDVGPRRAMPSGGLIAMGNARNLVADLSAGLLPLTLAQLAFLRRARKRYRAVAAVGDAYALAMALRVRALTVFVGTAKSVAVAPYGAFEERLLARASARFVRDEATAQALARHGIDAEVANAIVDLFTTQQSTQVKTPVGDFTPAIALFPGSREGAYEDGAFLIAVVAELAMRRPSLGAVLSVAPGLEAARFARCLQLAGFDVAQTPDPALVFVACRNGRAIVRGWCGPLGPLLERVDLVLGQAGTANEAAAAAGVPVVAFERDRDRETRWYRQRQRGLLGEALAVLPASLDEAVTGVASILDDPERRRRMGEIGRERMGPAGGARRIAQRIATIASNAGEVR